MKTLIDSYIYSEGNNYVYLLENTDFHKENYKEVCTQSKNIFFIDLQETNSDIEFNITLKDKIEVNVYVIVFNNKNTKKNYNVNFFHEGHGSLSNAQTLVMSFDKSETQMFLGTTIADNMKNNEAIQNIRGIIFNKGATIKAEPKLNIYNNDVKAKHALAIGKVNDDHLYYFQTRGLDIKMARSLIIQGYFKDLLSNLEHKDTRDILENKINERVHF